MFARSLSAVRRFGTMLGLFTALSVQATAQITPRLKTVIATIPAPQGFQVYADQYGVRLTWQPVAEAAQYLVMRGADVNTVVTQIGTVSAGTVNFLDRGFNAPAAYQVIALAVDGRRGASSVVTYTPPVAATSIATTPSAGTTLLSSTTAIATIGTIAPSGPTGPAPAGLSVSGTPMVAQVRWTAATGVASYTLWRSDGSAAAPVQRTPNGFTGVVVPDTVPDPRPTYTYRLVAAYTNGTWGEAQATFVSPAPSNPASLTATLLQPGAFRLSWPAVAGATRYRLDGATLPNTGGLSAPGGLWFNVINVPPGPQSWQVVALFPGGIADYNNPTRTSAVSRVLPPSPPFLVKNNGAGSEAMAQAHYSKLCCRNIGSLTSINDRNNYSYEWGAREVPYTNVTELGSARSTACFETSQGGRSTVCWSTSGSTITMIIKGPDGTRFLAFQDGATAANEYWGDRWKTVTTAALDSRGPRYVPHACLSCHGGVYNPQTGLVDGATLLPLDPGLLAVQNRPTQEEAIRKINALIFMSNPSPAVAKYISEMYGGRMQIPGAVAAPSYVPSGWATDANFYTGIVKKNCAMCHLAVRNGMDFMSVGNFLQFKDVIYNSVCKAYAMPHAEVPFKRLWTEDTGPMFVPGLVAARLGFASCP